MEVSIEELGYAGGVTFYRNVNASLASVPESFDALERKFSTFFDIQNKKLASSKTRESYKYFNSTGSAKGNERKIEWKSNYRSRHAKLPYRLHILVRNTKQQKR